MEWGRGWDLSETTLLRARRPVQRPVIYVGKLFIRAWEDRVSAAFVLRLIVIKID